jgi:hypothetical protein
MNKQMKFFKLIALLTLFCALYSCHDDDAIIENDSKSYHLKTSRVSVNQVLNEISSMDIKQKLQSNNFDSSISNSLLRSSESEDYFIKKEKDDVLTTYILQLNSYSTLKPYFLKLIITKNKNESERIGYIKYIPTSPTTTLDLAIFSGEVQILDIAFEVNSSSIYQNGILQKTETTNEASNRIVCVNEIEIREVKCSHGGNHGVGESCGPGYVNDAHFVIYVIERCGNNAHLVQIIEDTGNNNNGATSVNLGMALADNFANTQLTPDQKLIYYLNPSIREYLSNNKIVVSNPNYNPLLGGDPTMAIIDPEAEEFIDDLLNFLSNRDSDTIYNIINYLNINNYTLESITFINNLKDEIISNENNINSLNINSILELSTPLNRINNINDYLKCFNLTQPATFTIYVDQPTTNSNDAWSGNALDPNVGHTFISIKQGGTRRVLGYYPSTAVGLSDPSSPGSFENDGAHVYDVAISININTSQLTNLINYIKTKASSTYNLNTFNCSDFGMGASSIAGMPLGSAYGSWGFGGGDNPGQLGQNIRNMPTPTGAVKTTTTGNAASNIGTCN